MNEATIETMETTQPEAAEIMKPYTFRKLRGEDIFLMSKIIGKIGVKEFNACFENDGIARLVAYMMGEKAANADGEPASITYIAVTLEVADVVFNNLPKCENEIIQMLSRTSNLTVAQVKELDLAQFTEMVIDFIKKEEFRDFIKVVSKLFS